MAPIGSSELRKMRQGNVDGEIHWRSAQLELGFDPIGRFKDWSPERHRCFNAIAGEEMRAFGYELMHD